METKKINLGRVGLVPKGSYSPDVTYGRLHVVTYKNTTYWSKQEGNTGHEPVGEDEWWGILVDGQAAYAGAFDAMRATERANTAAKEAERTNAAVWGAEQMRESAEEERKTAETQRKEQAQSMAEAEQTRTDAEQRRTEAETQRVEAEKRRASEESLRAAAEETRKSDEADRIAGEVSREQQEESRVAAEQTRDAQETQRKIDETKRADAEAKRADAEDARKEAETGRVSAETGRAAAETARVKAETARADAETKRAAAETKRESDFSAKVEEVDTAVKNAKTATSEAEKVDATITEGNVFEVTGRDGVKKTLGLVEQAEAATIKAELAGKVDSNSDAESVVKDNSDAFYFVDSQGNVIGKLDKNGFHAIEVSSKKSNVSIIKDNDDTFYFADGYGNVVAKLDKNGFRANDFLDRNGNSIIKSLPMDDFGVEDGYSLVNKEKKIVASKKKISPLFGKNIYSFGDSLCSGVWEKYLAEMTGAIFNEKANMLTSWGGTFSGDTGGPLYNEEGYGKNGDMPGGARRATNFINMDEATYGTKDYIFFENVHDGSIELNEGEDSILNAIPFFVQQFKTAEYEAIDNNDAISYFNNNFTNLIALFDEPKPCSVIKIKINTFSHKLVFSGGVREGVISIKIGNKTFDTNIKDNDSLDEVINKINVWSFADTTAWKNSKIDATSMQLIYTGNNEGSKEDIITVDCGTTGLNCVISDSMSNSIRNMMFKSLDVSKWNDISLWEYATSYDNPINWWKGIIERIQTRCPNTKMYMCIFPNYIFNDSYIRADGSFDVDSWKKATSSYAKKNRHLLTLIADYYNIPVIDVEKEMMVMTNWKEFFSPNNVHFKNNLHQRIAEIISNHIVV